ncbi:MAG: PBSX family phage terminase large subunit [Veillonellaceae bacterium]|nr:PBSX family phage terminase large subunit [Veillonellaceae bacterium]
MPLTDMQREYLANCNHRWNIKTGATGSGKTFLDCLAVIPKRVLACKGEGLIVLLGNTRGTLERNVLEPMREIWPGLVGQISGDNTLLLFGHKAYALGADSKKHIARLQGTTIEYGYGDEITTWAQGVFEMLKSRLRCAHSHFDGTCNPDNPNHWFKTFLDSGADIFQQSYTIDDNPMLTPEYVRNIKAEYLAAGNAYYQRFILGKWASADGAIYRLFVDHPEQIIVTREWLTTHPLTACLIGVDFGGNGSGHAFCCTGFERGLTGVVTLAEWYHKGEITPEKLESAFVEFCRMCIDQYGARAAYCDSAESTLIKGLEAAAIRERLPIEVHKARKYPINDRIRFLTRQMGGGRYHIVDTCRHTIDALSSAVWDSKHTTEDVRLDNGTSNIDSLDALEYSFEPFMNDITQLGARR